VLSRHRNQTGQINHSFHQEFDMRGILLWLIGLPIPIIILLYLFNVL
jgi:hypothetical protein